MEAKEEIEEQGFVTEAKLKKGRIDKWSFVRDDWTTLLLKIIYNNLSITNDRIIIVGQIKSLTLFTRFI